MFRFQICNGICYLVVERSSFASMPLERLTRLTISSWNVQGLFKRNDNERVSKLNDEELLSHINSDSVCLLETKADHYENMPMQYTEIFHGCKIDNFQVKLIIFR